jgi:hypothetical protein
MNTGTIFRTGEVTAVHGQVSGDVRRLFDSSCYQYNEFYITASYVRHKSIKPPFSSSVLLLLRKFNMLRSLTSISLGKHRIDRTSPRHVLGWAC